MLTQWLGGLEGQGACPQSPLPLIVNEEQLVVILVAGPVDVPVVGLVDDVCQFDRCLCDVRFVCIVVLVFCVSLLRFGVELHCPSYGHHI